ncbi:uncharacterized protein ISCGN_010141 [Ixodes scapularis]
MIVAMKARILLVFSACITGAWSSDDLELYACQKRLMESEDLFNNTRAIHLPWDEFDVDRVSYFDRFSKVLLDRGTLIGFQDELLKNKTAWKGVIDSAGHKVTHNITIDGLSVNFRAFVTHSRFPLIGKAASALGLAWTDTHVLTMTVKKLTAQVDLALVHGDKCLLSLPIWNMETEVRVYPQVDFAEERQKKFAAKLKKRIADTLRRTIETMYRRALW